MLYYLQESFRVPCSLVESVKVYFGLSGSVFKYVWVYWSLFESIWDYLSLFEYVKKVCFGSFYFCLSLSLFFSLFEYIKSFLEYILFFLVDLTIFSYDKWMSWLEKCSRKFQVSRKNSSFMCLNFFWPSTTSSIPVEICHDFLIQCLKFVH